MSYIQNVYNGLMKLTEESDSQFFYEDNKINDKFSYRVFCYGIPRYNQYQKPYAKESRGSMFLIENKTEEMIDIVALPMPKFFTYGENPETSHIEFDDVKYVYLKADGSLLSTYLDLDNKLQFKTKRKPSQDSFNLILEEILYDELKKELTELTNDYTVDIELTSPSNRVILKYDEPKIHILRARNKRNGEFLDLYSEDMLKEYPEISKHLINTYNLDVLSDLTVKNRHLDVKGIEGFVVEMNDGTLFKVKTMYYLTQNRYANIQDLSKKDKLLVEACLEETFDELRTLFHYRNRSENYNLKGILDAMDSIEKQVSDTYNPFVEKINSFVDSNKNLSFEEYKNKAMKENMQKYMGIIMPMYKGQKVNLKIAYMNMIGSKLKS